MRRLLLYLLFSAMISSHAQDSAAYLLIYRQAEKLYASENSTAYTDSLALVRYQQVIALLEHHPANDNILFDCYFKTGILEMSAGRTEKAITSFSHSIAIGRPGGHLPDTLLFKPYLYTGSSYYDRYSFDSSLYYYKLAEKILDAHPGLGESERLYNKEGVLYYESGDYRRSIQYFSKAIAIVKDHQPSNTLLIVNYQNNIASSLLKLGEYNAAIDIYMSLLAYHSYRSELYYNIGTAWLNAGDPTRAIDYLRQSGYKRPAAYNNMARAWLALHKYDAASDALQRAYNSYDKMQKQQKSQDLGNTYKYTGDLLMALDSPAKALGCYQRAIIQLDRDFEDSTLEHNPVSFWGMHNSFLLFDALAAKAKAYYTLGDRTSDSSALIKAFAAYTAALTLARHVEKIYYSDEARLFLVKKADAAYKEAVALGYRLYVLRKDASWLEKAFDNMEASKASVLQARLGDPGSEALRGAALDLFIQQKRKKAEASKLNILLARTTDNAQSVQIQTRVRDIEIQVSALQDKLDQLPEYRRQKFTSNSIDLSTIRKQLPDDNAALISYYYTDRQLFCFYLTGQQFGCMTSAWTIELERDISMLRKSLDESGSADRQTITEITHRLSQQLIAQVYEKIKDKKRLLVVPYNDISYIPFEMLETPSAGGLLLKDFSISYAYSVNTLHKGNAAPLRKYEVLAMAPFTEAGPGNLPVLKSSAAEVKELPGRILQGAAATKEQFIRWSPRYPIIHLATHAVVNDEDPLRSYIEFYSPTATEADTVHRLLEQEIYHLDMNSAALVIISACETGSGQLVHGEGVISLSRAFSYAGCKSVITSLWKADDPATTYIVRRVHHYLSDGLPKDEALQRAKMDYLSDPGIEARYKAPFYWAHLVLLGDIHPVVKSSGIMSSILVIAAVILVVLTGWIIRKKYRARLPAPGRSQRINKL